MAPPNLSQYDCRVAHDGPVLHIPGFNINIVKPQSNSYDNVIGKVTTNHTVVKGWSVYGPEPS